MTFPSGFRFLWYLCFLAIGPAVLAQDEVTITCNDLSRFNTVEIRAKAGSKLTIVFKNTGRLRTIQHNLVILKEGVRASDVGNAAMNAKSEGYIPSTYRDRIVAHTKLLGSGQSERLTITVPPKGRYAYLCTYPGHYSVATGILISE